MGRFIGFLYGTIVYVFFFGVFLIKYKVEFLLTVPFFAFLFVWYMAIGMREDAITQRPEELYRERRFMAYIVFLAILNFTFTTINDTQI
ncbi:MAG: hypothetical protein IID52_01270 [Proteobacteria bacterium]|nr:hypothetical protein [Pseudomonadota bacterium]